MPQPTYCEPMDAGLGSRIRGLVLGIGVGDAVGSRASDVPVEGDLQAGAASQLAAWTIESLLRNATRYGGWHPYPPAAEAVLCSYQEWERLSQSPSEVVANGGEAHADLEVGSIKSWRGWLIDHPAMRRRRGSSPSTVQALATGRPQHSAGCQALLRILATAPMALVRQTYGGDRVPPDQAREVAREWARATALLTHDDGDRQGVAALAVDILAEALLASDDLKWAIKRASYDSEHTSKVDTHRARTAASDRPCVPQELERLAPDKTSWSALAGGIYVALSFPDEDSIEEAIEFAGWAPDGDSVAAVAGAILGARHGYEALPTQWVNRLELGWVLDRLAIDLAAEVHEHQGGQSWKDDESDSFPRCPRTPSCVVPRTT